VPFRELHVTIRYPIPGAANPADTPSAAALSGMFPLVVFAHGYALSDATYPRLLHDLAAEGFVVADPQFPLSSAALPGPAIRGDEVAQAADLAFVADQLLSSAARPVPLSSVILSAPLAVVGHSDGAITAAGLAANSCCADRRIGAAVLLSGALADFPGSWFTTASPPTLIIHGNADEVNPLDSSFGIYDAAHAPKMLVVVDGGTHIGAFEDDASRPQVVRLMADFLHAYLQHDADAAARLTPDAEVQGVLQLWAAER
jgi:pimeloyl-ACP methyl ester carboxylesterase